VIENATKGQVFLTRRLGLAPPRRQALGRGRAGLSRPEAHRGRQH
jgi:hypothetical protein